MHAAVLLQRREALHKFSQFDTSVKLLCILKTEKAPELFIICCSEFENLQNHAFTADSDDGVATLRECRSAVRIGSSNLLACPSKQSCTPNFRPLSVHTAPRRITHLLALLRSASLCRSRTAPPTALPLPHWPAFRPRDILMDVSQPLCSSPPMGAPESLVWALSVFHSPTANAACPLRRIFHPSHTALAGPSGLSSPCRCSSCLKVRQKN